MIINPSQGKLFIISAPSGTGKTSLVQALINESPLLGLRRVVTYTTKNPRAGEIEGVDYYFLSLKEFQHKIDQGFFLEWSNTYKDYYGSPNYILKELEKGVSYILITDWQGARAVKSKVPHAILIIIEVDYPTLEQRLKGRDTETIEQQAHRLVIAHKEMREQQINNHLIDYVVVNDFFSDALQKLKKIVTQVLEKTKKITQ